MTDAAIEWWGKAGDQALRRSAFQEAISHLGQAIEMKQKPKRSAARRATPAAAEQRLELQTRYPRRAANRLAAASSFQNAMRPSRKRPVARADISEAADQLLRLLRAMGRRPGRCEPAMVQEATGCLPA